MKIKLFSLFVLIVCILSLCSFVPREEIATLNSYDSGYDSISSYLVTPPIKTVSGFEVYDLVGCKYRASNQNVLSFSDFYTEPSYSYTSGFPAYFVLELSYPGGTDYLNVNRVEIDSNYDIYIRTDLNDTYYLWYDDSHRSFCDITINGNTYSFRTTSGYWKIYDDIRTFATYDDDIINFSLWLYNLSLDFVDSSLLYDLSFYDFGFFFESGIELIFDFSSNSLDFTMLDFSSNSIRYYDGGTSVNGGLTFITAYSEGIWNNPYNRIFISSGQELPRFFLNFLNVGSAGDTLNSGWYRFNEFITLSGGNGSIVYKTSNPDYYITFESNGNEYVGISFVPLGSNISYGDLAYSNGQWIDSSFRYFNVLEDSSVDSEFYSFVTSNSIYYNSNLPDYINGYNDGYSSGYDDGFSVGVTVGESNTVIRDFFVDLFTAVPRALDSIVMYSSDGVVVTLWGVIGMIFMIFALGWVLKLVAGG